MDTLPKHDWNLSCLSYGSNLLIKLDSVDVLRAQFEKFESHFRNNEHVIYDAKLPLFIIEMFSKLWKLWVDFPELQQVINRSTFYKVLEDMSSFLQGGSVQQEETIEVTDKAHVTEIENIRRPAASHYLLLDEFQGYAESSSKPKNPFAVPCPNFTPKYINGPVKTSCNNSGAVNLNSNAETSQSIALEPLESDSNRSSKDAENELRNFENTTTLSRTNSHNPIVHSTAQENGFTNNLFKLPSKEDPHCGPCCRSISEEMIEGHLQSMKHMKQVQLMSDCYCI